MPILADPSKKKDRPMPILYQNESANADPSADPSIGKESADPFADPSIGISFNRQRIG